jgi:hypothetical protein
MVPGHLPAPPCRAEVALLIGFREESSAQAFEVCLGVLPRGIVRRVRLEPNRKSFEPVHSVVFAVVCFSGLGARVFVAASIDMTGIARDARFSQVSRADRSWGAGLACAHGRWDSCEENLVDGDRLEAMRHSVAITRIAPI